MGFGDSWGQSHPGHSQSWEGASQQGLREPTPGKNQNQIRKGWQAPLRQLRGQDGPT